MGYCRLPETCNVLLYFSGKPGLHGFANFSLPATQRCFFIPLFVLCHEGLKSFFYIGRTKQGLHDRLTEQFKALAKNDNSSAIADRVDTNGPNTD